MNKFFQNYVHASSMVLLMMDADCDKDINDVDVGSVEGHVFNSQVLSNLAFTLQDPSHVSCRGKPKSKRKKRKKKSNKQEKDMFHLQEDRA